ncbi:aspartyl protease family protein [Robiginitalea aurantiaca]|uniref:Aspartyl protease family protein n=1 Tax=Robiginitalea aurantiaca TaxID=3056915 RepID=A0ABT7WHK8_9FLAO|nr:aspartyl protease family protein [Robiginitalea aurantiaca]MDM9632348.1 aspartyl protease family protein [Robiginitalea aurantiaca]
MRFLRQYRLWVFTAFLFVAGTAAAQYYELPEDEERTNRIHFQLINNLMVIPMEVNGASLNFILDSGVSKPILFNISDQDSIELRDVSKITIRGLGNGEPVDALRSLGNTFRINSLKNLNQELYVVLNKEMNFSSSLGIPVHGIIGYDLFRDFVVEINYNRQFIRFHDPQTYQSKNRKDEVTLPLTVTKNKAFLHGSVVVDSQGEIPVKLLMDTGSSDALWLFPDAEKGLSIPEKHYEDYLGKGLSGTIYGKRTKIRQVRLGDFILNDAKTAFPDMESFKLATNLGDRNGSAGGELLKRFNMIVNYPGQQITLSKNALFDKPFQFNLAGIELEHAGIRYIAERIAHSNGFVQKDESTYSSVQIMVGSQTRLSLVPEIVVSAIRAGSPAEEVGLREGDVILAVNGKPVHRYKLQEVLEMINYKKGKNIRLLIERYNQDLLFSFVLRDLFE